MANSKTISTHNGYQAYRAHNIRLSSVADKLTDRIDPALRDQNETLIDEAPRDAYARIFGDALSEYNAKQTRAYLRINDYYTHICNDKRKHPVYEMIIQVGDRNDTGIKPNETQTERAILREFIKTWKQRNPNLELIGAYIHADEVGGTLHAHLDYIPVARGYKNGLSVQTALVKALEQQGIEKGTKYKDTAQIHWEKRENNVLEQICNSHGIEVYHPLDGRKHENIEQYKVNQALWESQARYEAERELRLEKLERNIKDKETKSAGLDEEIKQKKDYIIELNGEILKSEEVSTGKGKAKGAFRFFDQSILLTKQLNSVIRTAERVNDVIAENKVIKRETAEKVKNAENERDSAIRQAKERVRSLEARENAVAIGEVRVKDENIKNLESHIKRLNSQIEDLQYHKEFASQYLVKDKKGREMTISELAEQERQQQRTHHHSIGGR